MTSLLRLSNLRKNIAGRRLLEIPEFDITAVAGIVLTGRNGTGKSTLLRILAGLELPDRADVTYQGRTTDWHPARPRLQRNGRDSASSPHATHAACPAEKNNGAGSPVPGYFRPSCYCWTSRWPTWTTNPGPRPCSPATSRRSVRPWAMNTGICAKRGRANIQSSIRSCTTGMPNATSPRP